MELMLLAALPFTKTKQQAADTADTKRKQKGCRWVGVQVCELAGLGTEPRALHMLGKYCTTDMIGP